MKIAEIGKFKFNLEYGVYRGPFIKEPRLGITYRFDLFDYDSDGDNRDLIDAMVNFNSVGAELMLSAGVSIFEFYQDIRKQVEVNGDSPEGFPIIESSNDVFSSFRFPKDIGVFRDCRSQKVFIRVICSWIWNDNTGYWLQIVLENGSRVSRISSSDGYLTNSEAFGCSSFDASVYVKYENIPDESKPKFTRICNC